MEWAYALALSRPAGTSADDVDGLTRVLAIGASYVRRAGVVLLESLSKVDALVTRDGQRLVIDVHGQSDIVLGVRQARAPDGVVVNGGSTSFAYHESECLVRFAVALDGAGR